MKKKLFIVSNRLPLHIEKVQNNVAVKPARLSLVKAVNCFIEHLKLNESDFAGYSWIGVPGCSQGEWVEAKRQLEPGNFDLVPVFVNQKIYDQHFNGLCNSVIWPLFHYFPSFADCNTSYYKNYIKTNEDFFDILLRNVRETDVVWIHDYHLLPLAALIRERFPAITIGFFLHIPFPSFELFRTMPDKWQQELLSGLLGADLIGFQTIDYASHFVKCLQMVLGVESDNNVVKYRNRLVKIDVFPIGIDFGSYHNLFNHREVASLRNFYKQQFSGKKILFSIDKLDYTKGVFSRMKAYETFLSMYPAYKEKVVFIMVVIPSHDAIPLYAERKKEIDEYIGNINSSTGSITWKPVIYQYSNLEENELLGLYTACDVAVVTPLRDGMNITAKEFVASRRDSKGVLILSQMTGAARELSDALLVNPNDTEGFAEAIKVALEMPAHEQKSRMEVMQGRISSYDVHTWADDFFTQLHNIKEKQKEFDFMFLDRDAKMLMYEKYHAAKNRLILLDYDGTIIPFTASPQQTEPEESLLRLLEGLSKNKDNTVFIISGRQGSMLEKWLGHLPVHLVAEHGAKIKRVNEDWQTDRHAIKDETWKKEVKIVMERYVKRCANTSIEDKDYSVVWHYRNADADQAKLRANELFVELNQVLGRTDVQIITGNKIIEVKIKGINKGNYIKKLLNEKAYDFILALGDDNTDEEMFEALATVPGAFTIKIGDAASYAKYNLYTPQMALSLLAYFESIYL